MSGRDVERNKQRMDLLHGQSNFKLLGRVKTKKVKVAMSEHSAELRCIKGSSEIPSLTVYLTQRQQQYNKINISGYII